MHCRLSEVRAARPAAIALYFYSIRRAFWRGRRLSAELKSRLPCVPGSCREGVRPKCRLVRNRGGAQNGARRNDTLPHVVVGRRGRRVAVCFPLSHALSWWTADGARRNDEIDAEQHSAQLRLLASPSSDSTDDVHFTNQPATAKVTRHRIRSRPAHIPITALRLRPL